MARIEIDPKMQPPTSQKKPNSGDDQIAKGLERDKLELSTLSEDTTKVGDSSTVVSPVTKFSGSDGGLVEEETQVEIEVPEIQISESQWLTRAKTAFDTSSSYFDNNVRGELDDSIRAFHNQHKSGSHFSTTTSMFSSKVYRPKTRCVINKYEACADAAYFSNPDVISIEAENPSSKDEVIGAAVVKALMQYRLTKTIPWYHVVIGGFQDAQVQGLAVAHYYWKVKTNSRTETHPLTGEELVSKYLTVDEPMVDLIPLENIRFDPNSSWTNIVESSPFIIHMRPMYVCDIKDQIENGFFINVDDSDIDSAIGSSKDGMNTRTTRAQSGQDPRAKSSAETIDYEICIVQEHIHRVNGEDYVFYTLNNEVMLRDPVPIKELYFTGDRPYIIGSCNLETHNCFVSSTPTLLSGIQEEINEVANQRLNNVKLAMNKKFIIKTESEIDLSSLLRNQPGSAVYTQDPAGDVRELNTPDVTQSSYLEQDRLNGDFDELAGNFSMQSMQNQKGPETWRGQQMLNSNANIQLEHQLRIFTDTFVTPLLRALIKLEQNYETDETIFAIVGQQNAQLFQKYGVDQATDEMLQHELTVKVNVGMNNTDPQMKLQKFISAAMAVENIMKSPVAAKVFDLKEMVKEIYALSGYGDGTRFINQGQDPAIVQMQQQIMMLQKKVQDKETHEKVSLQKTRETNQTKLTIEQMKHKNNNAQFLAKNALDIHKTQGSEPQQQPMNGDDPNVAI